MLIMHFAILKLIEIVVGFSERQTDKHTFNNIRYLKKLCVRTVTG